MTTTNQNEHNLLMHICRMGRLWVCDYEHPSSQAVAYESLVAYASEPSQPIVDWATGELEDFSVIALQHAVKQFYLQYGTPEEKLAYGHDERPYSVCVHCHKLVRWDKEAGALVDPDEEFEPAVCEGWEDPILEQNPHVSKWLTLGELRDRTAHLPDTFPITGDAQGPNAGPAREADWYNLRLIHVPTLEEYEQEEPSSLLLDITDDFDNRQW